MNQMKKMKENENFSKKIINNYFLRKLIIDSSLNSSEEYENEKHTVDLTIDLDQPLLLCIIKIDGFAQYIHHFTNKDKKLIEFSISNIIQKIIVQVYLNRLKKI